MTDVLDEPRVIVFTGRECLAIARSLEITEAMQEACDAPQESVRKIRSLRDRMLVGIEEEMTR